MKLYTDFTDILTDETLMAKLSPAVRARLLLLKDAEIELNCDGNIITNRTSGTPTRPYTPYFGAFTAPARYKQDCHDNVPVLVRQQLYRKEQL